MSATITKSNRLENAKDYITKNFSIADGNTSHFYTGMSLPWDDQFSPDVSTSSDKEIYDTKFQRIFMKKIDTTDVSLSIRKYVWESGVVYTRADYNVEYTDYRNWEGIDSPFYVINSEGNVYKCIANNYGIGSVVEPTGTSLGYIYLGDGYMWKFMLDLTTAIEDAFLTDTWIPVPHEVANKSFNQTQVESNAVIGDISYIHVVNGGTGYTSPPTIQIRGDGTGAVATAIMSGESIKSISISNNGSDYTYAEISIYGNGVGAVATAMISPPNGHGSDASSELGAFYVEIMKEIIGSEDTIAPITGTYRNVGICRNTLNKTATIITDTKLNTLSVIHLLNCSGNFTPNELLIGSTSKSQGILYSDPSGVDKDLSMYMIEGSFIDGEVLYGQESGEYGEFSDALSTYTTVDIHSGDILYKENIIFITRREIQTEKFVFTIEF